MLLRRFSAFFVTSLIPCLECGWQPNEITGQNEGCKNRALTGRHKSHIRNHRNRNYGRPLVLFSLLVAISGSLQTSCAQTFIPTGDQLDQLVAPIALYPDPLLAQVTAASQDPQQILDVNSWLRLNRNLEGQALTDAAQRAGFDPAFISLVNFPEVLGMMAAHINDFAALGAAFQADQRAVMDSVQRLRQRAFATGVLDSNEFQTVRVENQGGTQVVVVQPANPQIVFVPQYDPVQAFAFTPGPSSTFGASLVGFGSGVALGAWLTNGVHPWYWGGWGWGWGRGTMMWRGNPWVWRPVYRPPRRWFAPRPPVFRPPPSGWGRPPNNWANRPGRRPPPAGWRPVGPGTGGRPPVAGPRPPAGGGRPPGPRPGTTRPPAQGSRPPGQGGGGRPPGQGGGGRPSGEGQGARPPGQGGGGRPPGQGGNAPGQGGRPRRDNQFAGHQRNQQGSRPAQTGGRPGAFTGNSNGSAARQASNRGRASVGGAGGRGQGQGGRGPGGRE
jgi:hypothetical protein